MKIIEYWISLEQPLLATSLQGDPNSSVSFGYIPGSQVRGLLINRYIERNALQSSDIAGDEDCQRLFFGGRTRYLNAYPLSQSEQRCLPTPTTLVRPRASSEAKAYDTSHGDWNVTARSAAEGDDQLKPLEQRFCWPGNNGSLELYKLAPNTVAIHVLRERRKGRATADGGAIFQYDALAPGQWFAGVILADHDTDEDTIRDLLTPSAAWLGRSRSAEYGRVRIELRPRRTLAWREAGGAVPSSLDRAHITITLLSDAIVRDRDGSAVSFLTSEILSDELGAKVAIKPEHSNSAGAYQGGFNRSWELPLIQTPALQAGSVLTFELVGDTPTIDVERLERQGIGERRAEGFGRIAFDWLRGANFSVAEGSCYSSNQSAPATLSAAATSLAQRMARQLRAAQIEQGLLLYVRDNPIANAPRNSQLARVRVLIRRALRTKPQLQVVSDGLRTFKEVSRQQFQAARIEGRALWDWLNALLAEVDQQATDTISNTGVWAKIKPIDPRLGDDWPAITVVGTPVPPDAQLSGRTALQLIDAVLAEAMRANKRDDRAPSLEEAIV